MIGPRVLVTRRPPGDALKRLRAACRVDLWAEDRPIPPEELCRRAGEAEGIYSMLTDPIDEPLLEAAPLLRVVSNMAVGVDNIDVPACTRRGIPVGHTPEVLKETVADTVFALLMAAARRIVEGVDYVRAGKWGPWDPELLLGQDVHAGTLGIIGLGRIGRAVARRGTGFGMRLLYHNRRPDPEAETAMGTSYRALEELLEQSDFVVVLCPLTAETYHLIDEGALRRMKPTAILVNGARGGIVDPKALERALREGWISAAALDVTEPEPIEPDDPLLALPNCIIIPHLGSASQATRVAMADMAVANLLAGLQGEQLPRCVNPEVYGREGCPQ
ncbi:MAG: D-glycerate dehydrogenase [Actinomycetota bacterium]|nr:D-glycerate dehydrogenase [Actinomycetota bacterium]